MSYLTLPGGIPDFSRTVISLWFRVPQESIIAAAQESFAEDERLAGIIPLVVFGEMFEGYEINNASAGSGSYTMTSVGYAGTDYFFISSVTHEYSTGTILSQGKVVKENPSFIGVDCYLDENTGELSAKLRVRLQTGDFGSGAWAYNTQDDSISNHTELILGNEHTHTDTAYDIVVGDCVTKDSFPGGERIATSINRDHSDIWTKQKGPDAIEAGDLEITPDRWHHLLISFDLNHSPVAQGTTIFDAYGCSPTPVRSENSIRAISDPYQMWIALDDVNYANEHLADPRLPGFRAEGLGANGVAPFYSLYTTFITTGGHSSKNWATFGLVAITTLTGGGMPTYTSKPGIIPSAGQEFGIPCTSSLFNHIKRVEMAEFQMWTGVTLDTGSETNRRAFVDADGEPVKPKGTADDPRAPAEKLLGKPPEILLHGSSKWKTGYNTGTLGVTTETSVDEEGTVTETVVKIASGQFTPTAKIEKYKPEPALEPETA